MDDIYTDDEDLWDVPEVPVPGDDGAVGAAAEADDAGDAVADESSELAFDADTLDAKLLRHFSGKIVRKDLTSLMKRSANVPTFVLEYLLGMYCSTDDEEGVEETPDERGDPEAQLLRMEEETYQRLVLRKLRMRNPQNYDILIKTKMHRIPASEVAEEYGITTNNVNNRNLRSKAWIIEELEILRRQSHL